MNCKTYDPKQYCQGWTRRPSVPICVEYRPWKINEGCNRTNGPNENIAVFPPYGISLGYERIVQMNYPGNWVWMLRTAQKGRFSSHFTGRPQSVRAIGFEKRAWKSEEVCLPFLLYSRTKSLVCFSSQEKACHHMAFVRLLWSGVWVGSKTESTYSTCPWGTISIIYLDFYFPKPDHKEHTHQQPVLDRGGRRTRGDTLELLACSGPVRSLGWECV